MDTVARLLEAHAAAPREPEIAEAICREILDVEPEDGFALHLVGVLRLRRGDTAQAQSALRRAVAVRPGNFESRIALAEALVRGDSGVEAADELTRALGLRPGHVGALVALAMVRLQLGQAEAAGVAAERARAAAPHAVEPLVALGAALSAMGRTATARAVLAEAVARSPSHAQAHLNLGNVLLDLDMERAAESHLRLATELQPEVPEAWASLGFLLTGTDRLDEAVACFDAAIALRGDFAPAYRNRSFAKLRAGDFAGGWADYEWQHPQHRLGCGASAPPGREWDGGDLSGCRLLVISTQGLGDTIQLARYLPLLVAKGATVTLCCQVPLLCLLAQLPVALSARGEPWPPHDL